MSKSFKDITNNEEKLFDKDRDEENGELAFL